MPNTRLAAVGRFDLSGGHKQLARLEADRASLVPVSSHTVRIGLLGCGNVGSALVELIEEQHQDICELTGIDLVVKRIAVRDASKPRGASIDSELLTEDVYSVVAGDDIDLVVELVGGIQPAYEWVKTALENNTSVVTGNKALLAEHGRELFEIAANNQADLLFEAAVAGGIPLIRALQQSLRGEPVKRVMGIVNGTTNYMLSAMTESGAAYDEVLAKAQSLGYAEADPTADVEGLDAQAKAAIIATTAFGASIKASDVPAVGISSVTAEDISEAKRLGYVIKLLAVVERHGDQAPYQVAAGVHPTMVPLNHPLASVRGAFNAVFIEGGAVGELMLYGRGAGGRPTASAVLGDVIAVSRCLASATHVAQHRVADAHLAPAELDKSAWYLSVKVNDEPGVLAEVAGVFGKHGISIRSMEQTGLEREATLNFITHEAAQPDIERTILDLENVRTVTSIGSRYRVMANNGE